MKVARERLCLAAKLRERGIGKAASEHLPKSRMGILSRECSAVVGRPGLVERGRGDRGVNRKASSHNGRSLSLSAFHQLRA